MSEADGPTGDEKLVIAYHEAGHAVIAEAVGLRVKTVYVERNGPRQRKYGVSGGRCEVKPDETCPQADIDCYALAAMYAEQRIATERGWKARFGDAWEWAEIVERLLYDEPHESWTRGELTGERLTYLCEQEARAERLVNEWWPAVVAVAEAMADSLRNGGNGRLTGREVRRLIAGAMGEPVVVTVIDTMLAPKEVQP